LPDELFAPVGTVLTVQVLDHLSSNKNSSGEQFMAALQQPLVIDGWVVARPGQTVFGVITSANSAGRVKGTSDLTLELTEMVLVDGHQAGIRTQLLKNYGKDSRGEDTATIAGVTAVGAVIGAAADGGKGALIGAAIGAGAATAGVLSTRGKAVEIYPESTLTFRLDAPLVVSTVRSQQAFLPVNPDDYGSSPRLRTPPRQRERSAAYEPYPPDYGRYPRFPGRYPGRVGVVPSIIIVPEIIINHRVRRRW
jgi:type IV secretion system protein VirB10